MLPDIKLLAPPEAQASRYQYAALHRVAHLAAHPVGGARVPILPIPVCVDLAAADVTTVRVVLQRPARIGAVVRDVSTVRAQSDRQLFGVGEGSI